jgi:hypothetical protein
MSTLTCKTFVLAAVENYMKEVRQDWGYEGVVMYFLDSKMNTIGLLKKKTTWYIIVRAIREKLRSYVSAKRAITVDDLKSNITKRLKQIQIWIGFDGECFEKWSMLSKQFVDWFVNALDTKKIVREDYYSKFPTLWYVKKIRSKTKET